MRTLSIRGFSILEATVSMAVLGVLSLGALALSSETQKGIARANSGSEIARSVSNVEMLVKNSNQCGCNLKGKALVSGSDGALSVELDRLLLGSQNCIASSTVLERGMRLGLSEVKSITLRVHSVNAMGRGLGQFELAVSRDGQPGIEKTMLVPVQLDQSRTKVLGCGIAEGDEAAGLWVDYIPKPYTGPIGAQNLLTGQWSQNVSVTDGIAYPVTGSPYYTWGVYANSPSEYCVAQGFAGGASGACRAYHGANLMGEGSLLGNYHWEDGSNSKIWSMACHLGGAEGGDARASGPNIMAPTKIMCLGSAAVPQQTIQFHSIAANGEGLPAGWSVTPIKVDMGGRRTISTLSIPATGVARVFQIQSQLVFNVNGSGGMGVYLGFEYRVNSGPSQRCNNNHTADWSGVNTKPPLGTDCMLMLRGGESVEIELQAYTSVTWTTVDQDYLDSVPRPPLFRVLVQTGVSP